MCRPGQLFVGLLLLPLIPVEEAGAGAFATIANARERIGLAVKIPIIAATGPPMVQSYHFLGNSKHNADLGYQCGVDRCLIGYDRVVPFIEYVIPMD